jgi:hypothetical protein
MNLTTYIIIIQIILLTYLKCAHHFVHDAVIECKAIPVLIRALGTSKQSVRDECIKCLGIIISSSSRHRDIVLDSGGLIAL